MGLEHNFLFISSDEYCDEIWMRIRHHPLRIDNNIFSELNYVDIHDDFINYFNDFFKWIEMYNPSKKEKIYGLCHYGVTVIKNENLKKMAKIIDSIISLFENSPKIMELTGMYTSFVEDIIDEKEILTDGHYEIMKIRKDKFMKKIIKLKNIVKKTIEENGYIIHLGI